MGERLGGQPPSGWPGSPPRVAAISARTSAYWEGETTTATEPLFLAAARIMVGPPMSMFSITVSRSAPEATAAANG